MVPRDFNAFRTSCRCPNVLIGASIIFSHDHLALDSHAKYIFEQGQVMFNPDTALGGGAYYLGSFEAAAKTLAVEPIMAPVRSDSDIEGTVASIGRERGGIVGMNDSFISIHRRTLILSAARESVPAIADVGGFPREGGLMTYGPNNVDLFRRAVPYVDSILRGANPADLPVQLPIKFDLTINLRTARALGLDISPALLSVAYELIE
jgi:putative tryptophan/tyrosine transport system substrate-binding protein